MNFRKKLAGFAAVLIITAGFAGENSSAQPLGGFDSGIENQSEYREMLFLTGVPILMKGTVKTSVKTSLKKGVETKKEDYKYSLQGVSPEGKPAVLTRNLSISSTLSKSGSQWTEESKIDKFDETVQIDGKTYRATRKDSGKSKNGSYQWDGKDKSSEFTRSLLYDKKPSIDYYAGNFSFRKVYKGEGESILVDMEGASVGYDSSWGSTETREMVYYISSEKKDGVQGVYTVKTSNNITKDLDYVENRPALISFRGGYMISEKDESVMEYSYDIKGKTGKGAHTLANNPKFTRLYAPVFSDVKGHWAQEEIDILTAMKAIEPKGKNFGPSLPISREDFAKAVARITDITAESEGSSRKSKKQKEEALYRDVSTADKEYAVVRAVSVKGLMVGVGEEKFAPKQEMTNAQAAQILMLSLGYENLAPGGAYAVGFADEDRIPYWAKDAVYMAKQIGLMTGTEEGYFHPDKTLTRAQAAVLLRDYMNYMSEELREDFRERIMNY
ncbi:MAG: S-layer homology domain-containing protein [Peptostreptococcaceae bacterium]|nr:S-layer homology domain-containing protein [Peptostreptococcaceae bacterium]